MVETIKALDPVPVSIIDRPFHGTTLRIDKDGKLLFGLVELEEAAIEQIKQAMRDVLREARS